MSDELSKILAEIDFPVRYNKPNQLIEDANSLPLLKVYAAGVMTYNASIFGEELARLINTLDPKRESVSDEEIENRAILYGGQMEFDPTMNQFQAGSGGFLDGALWMRNKLEKAKP